jgi:hypothetical protein
MNSNQFNTIFDDSNFPIVRLTFGNTISNEEFEEIKKNWLKQYLNEADFYIIFDTSNMNTLPISYIYKLSQFISNLKKIKNQYLKASILLIKSNFVRNLYSFYLKLQKPISKVYIVKNEEDVEIIINKLKNKEKITEYTEYNP